MNISTIRDIQSLGVLKRLSAAAAATAAGAGDAATTTGVTIDRAGFATGSMPMSADIAVVWDATVATGKTLSIGYAIQDSADGSTFADYQVATYSVVATGVTAASVLAGEFKIPVSLTSARRYIRVNSNIDLNNSATDTAVSRSVGFFAGFDKIPSPNA